MPVAPEAFEPLRADDPATAGGYRLYARLGVGGMGCVYLAFTPGGRPVAVKVVRADLAADREFRARFAQEALAAQRVNGIHIAQLLDADPDAERPWLATAYVPGPVLSEAVRPAAPLPLAAVRTLVAGVADALAAIHAAGIVHRDLKPGNVVLGADGPRVIDFGIARATDATALTLSGSRIGSPQYMAPEQILGRGATPATDVFALGALAYYAATGLHTFGEGPEFGIVYRVVNEPPDLTGCPPELAPLITDCLAKEPEARPTPADIVAACRPGGDRRPGGQVDWLSPAVTEAIEGRVAALRTLTAEIRASSAASPPLAPHDATPAPGRTESVPHIPTVTASADHPADRPGVSATVGGTGALQPAAGQGHPASGPGGFAPSGPALPGRPGAGAGQAAGHGEYRAGGPDALVPPVPAHAGAGAGAEADSVTERHAAASGADRSWATQQAGGAGPGDGPPPGATTVYAYGDAPWIAEPPRDRVLARGRARRVQLAIAAVLVLAGAAIGSLVTGKLMGGPEDGGGAAGPTQSPAASAPESVHPTAETPSAGATRPEETEPADEVPMDEAREQALQWKGTVTLTERGADLDTVPPSVTAQFGDIDVSARREEAVAVWGGATLVSNGPNLVLWTRAGPPDRRHCADLVAGQGAESVAATPGQIVCVRTNLGHVATVTVGSVSPGSADVVADVQVWQATTG